MKVNSFVSQFPKLFTCCALFFSAACGSSYVVKPTRTVDASVRYESNMFDTTAVEPLVIDEYRVTSKGKLGDDTGSERVEYSRAMAKELATQLVIKTEATLRARWPK